MSTPLFVILPELRTRLRALYGPRLERLILFGSRARADAEPDSDIDVLVVLKDAIDRRAERERTIEIVADLCLQYDTVIMPVFADGKTYDESDFSLYRNIRREGIGF